MYDYLSKAEEGSFGKYSPRLFSGAIYYTGALQGGDERDAVTKDNPTHWSITWIDHYSLWNQQK